MMVLFRYSSSAITNSVSLEKIAICIWKLGTCWAHDEDIKQEEEEGDHWLFPLKYLSWQLTYWELTMKLTGMRTLSYLLVNSKDDSHCGLAVRFPWVITSHGERAVSYSWDNLMSSPWELQTHWKTTALQAHSVSSCCEFTVR